MQRDVYVNAYSFPEKRASRGGNGSSVAAGLQRHTTTVKVPRGRAVRSRQTGELLQPSANLRPLHSHASLSARNHSAEHAFPIVQMAFPCLAAAVSHRRVTVSKRPLTAPPVYWQLSLAAHYVPRRESAGRLVGSEPTRSRSALGIGARIARVTPKRQQQLNVCGFPQPSLVHRWNAASTSRCSFGAFRARRNSATRRRKGFRSSGSASPAPYANFPRPSSGGGRPPVESVPIAGWSPADAPRSLTARHSAGGAGPGRRSSTIRSSAAAATFSAR